MIALGLFSLLFMSSISCCVLVSRQLCWKDHLDFRCHAGCMDGCNYVWMYGGCLSTKMVNLCWNAMTDFIKLGIVVGTSIIHVVCCYRMRILNKLVHLHIWWLITKKASIQSSVWATVMKLGMVAVICTDITHVVCRQQMYIFAHLHICSDWVIKKKRQISRVLYWLLQ